MIDDIVAMTQARSAFSDLINQVNQVLQFIVTGQVNDGGELFRQLRLLRRLLRRGALTIPIRKRGGRAMAVSPMMQQYLRIKEQYKDAILFFRLGDFYEMFFEDAILVSRELELTLTGKDCGLSERAPMCGVPFHAVDTYLARADRKGL